MANVSFNPDNDTFDYNPPAPEGAPTGGGPLPPSPSGGIGDFSNWTPGGSNQPNSAHNLFSGPSGFAGAPVARTRDNPNGRGGGETDRAPTPPRAPGAAPPPAAPPLVRGAPPAAPGAAPPLGRGGVTPPVAPPVAPPVTPPAGPYQPGYESNGYNPLQYANLKTANDMATSFGGNAVQTRGVGAGAAPDQNMINMGGGNLFNAGLTAQNVQRYGLEAAQKMMQAEMNLPGASNPNWQNEDSVFRMGGDNAQIRALPGGVQAGANNPAWGTPGQNGGGPALNPGGGGGGGNGRPPAPPAGPAAPPAHSGGGAPTASGAGQDPRFVGGAIGNFDRFSSINNFMPGGSRGNQGGQLNAQSLLAMLLGRNLGGNQSLAPGQRGPGGNGGFNPNLMGPGGTGQGGPPAGPQGPMSRKDMESLLQMLFGD